MRFRKFRLGGFAMLEYRRSVLQEGRFGFGGRFGQCLTDGYFLAARGGGYAFYLGKGSEEHVDFDHPVAACGPDIGQLQLPLVLQWPDAQYHLACRAVGIFGLQSDDYAVLRIYFDSQSVGYAMPETAFDLKAFAIGGGLISLCWRYEALPGSAAVATFKIYGDNGTGQIDYQTVLGQVTYRQAGRCYRWISTQLDQTKLYRFGVRAYNAAEISDGNSKYVTARAYDTVSADVPAVVLNQQQY